jgi:hypothetical protein
VRIEGVDEPVAQHVLERAGENVEAGDDGERQNSDDEAVLDGRRAPFVPQEPPQK